MIITCLLRANNSFSENLSVRYVNMKGGKFVKYLFIHFIILLYNVTYCTFSLDVLTDGFSCPDGDVVGPNGRILPHPTFAHPDDCQKFYICRNGVIPQFGSCSSGSVYNEVSFKCDDPENVPGWWVWHVNNFIIKETTTMTRIE